MAKIYTQIVSLVLVLKYAKSEVFTAVSDMDLLLETHQSVIDSLEDYFKEQEKRLETLKYYKTLYKNEHKVMRETTNYLQNPLNSFTLIKRLTSDLEYLENIIAEGATLKKREGIVYPTRDDLEGAGTALSRLQTTYLLNTTHLANGRIAGTFSYGQNHYVDHTAPLSAHDCFQIGLQMRPPNIMRALEWFHEAYSRYKNNEIFEQNNTTYFPLHEFAIVEAIQKSYAALEDFKNAIEWTETLIHLQPGRKEELEKDLATYKEELVKKESKQILNAPANVSQQSQISYEALCRGDVPLPDEIKKDLKCYYKQGPEPFLKLAPIKAEQLLLQPPVMIFHEVISDEEIFHIKNLSRATTFARSGVRNIQTGKTEHSSIRISKNAWLNDQSEVVAKVSRRTQDFTGLSMETAELFQVANYGLGGHYVPHFDYLQNLNDTMKGNRIGTVLYYISEVEQGGATVFMHAPGLTVFPRIHSALFWYNMLPSGEQDMRTMHGGCPVLRGSKWVANKWIRERAQEFRRPCALTKE